jgi:uncharacterized protein
MPLTLVDWCRRCEAEVAARCASDPGHDLEHVRRVVANARLLLSTEPADPLVVLPAAWLHDLVQIAKDDPRRAQASRLAAEAACAWLREEGFPAERLAAVHHAIHAHSFSAQVPCQSLEARVLQDADRLDALGAIGIARTFLCGGAMGRPLYAEADPFCDSREPDDGAWNLDHFYRKLLGLADSMHSASGRAEAGRRCAFMRHYLAELRRELDQTSTSS